MSEYEQIKRIYGALKDKSSRTIFEKRLMYSLSGEKSYIHEMVSLEMGRYGNRDIMMQVLAWVDGQRRPVVIFGAGFAGCQIASVLLYAGKAVKCLVDNNRKIWGIQRHGLTICEPNILTEMEECCVIIGTNACVSEIKRQILDLGIDESRIFIPDKKWWLGTEVQYFDQDIMKGRPHESFVDGGALDGGDSREFIKWCNGDFDAIYLFEPDVENCRKMTSWSKIDGKIQVYEEGLWSGPGELRFLAGIGENSVVSKEGNTVIHVTSIDEKLQGKPVTVIKMDIEGCELEALKGAEDTIRKYKPRLAVCVYHRPEDIMEIPQKILELNPEYRLYLRHYSYVETETVLYAI